MDPPSQPQPQSNEKRASSPQSSTNSPGVEADTFVEQSAPPVDPTPAPALAPRSNTIDVVEHRIHTGFSSLRRKYRKSTFNSAPEWLPSDRPYRNYVQNLVSAGWNNLLDLNTYLATHHAQQIDLTISVLDVSTELKRWPDIHTEQELQVFLDSSPRGAESVRLILAEYAGVPSSALIETLGSALKLDPRFFQWSIHSKGHVFSPSQRHRAPFVSLVFGVLNASTPGTTDAERFKVMIYIQPDEGGNGWTGLILFTSLTKISLSACILIDPPPFGSTLPPHRICDPKPFREIYIDSFEFLDLTKATSSPFYIVSPLLKLDCFCWNEIITAIREEDRRIRGISDTTIGHAEEIKKSLDIVKRGGSLGWPGASEPITMESKAALEEDFAHLVDQTSLLWQTRDRLVAIREHNSEARWTTLTNAFTYIFAPITIMTGIYGMNVSQISGSSTNPNIWQFFVAVAVFNVVAVLVLAVSAWVQIHLKHSRSAGFKEVLLLAMGHTKTN